MRHASEGRVERWGTGMGRREVGHWHGEEGGGALDWGGGRWGTGLGRREVGTGMGRREVGHWSGEEGGGALEWGGGRIER